MDLADKLIQQQQEKVVNSDGEELKIFQDNTGLCTYVKDPENPVEAINDPKYWSIRIRAVNRMKYNKNRQGLLHRRGCIFYIGSEAISRSYDNLNRLAEPQFKIPKEIASRIWDDLYDYVPKLSYDKIAVTPNLVWNKKDGTLEQMDEPALTTGKGGFNV